MTTELAQGDHNQPQDIKQGHCSRCGKVWTLAEAQGVCQWCGKQGTCQHQKRPSRSIKTRQRKQVPSYDKCYDQLPEPQLTYYKVASRFNRKALIDDQEDLLHDIILHLIVVERNNGHKPLTEAMMYRIASHVKDHYWYSHYKLTMGLDCQHCSKAQRHKCKEDWLYGDCPKAIKLESLNKPIIDSEGNVTEFGDLIADDKALDLDDWIDAGTFLLGNARLKGIAQKKLDGIPLDGRDQDCLDHFRKRKQIKLF